MNRIVIITGANNGIGLAMTQSLLEWGERVAALDLSLENIDPGYPNLIARVCDVTDLARVQSVVEEVVREWGGVDVLVNNACLALYKPFVDRTIEEIRRELEVNYFGYLNTIAAVLPVMRRQNRGVIHNISSGIGYTGMPGMTGYTSAKGAIESLTRTLALELAEEGIAVNIMHPRNKNSWITLGRRRSNGLRCRAGLRQNQRLAEGGLRTQGPRSRTHPLPPP
jgi:NAD(P)-dependent dehydrogenase (short-subunit alcohol dehydrogenase family)